MGGGQISTSLNQEICQSAVWQYVLANSTPYGAMPISVITAAKLPAFAQEMTANHPGYVD